MAHALPKDKRDPAGGGESGKGVEKFVTIAEHLQALVSGLGPRAAAGAREEAIAEYVTGQCKALGLEAQRQRFQAGGDLCLSYTILLALVPLAAAAFFARPGLGFTAALAAAFAYMLEAGTYPAVSRLLPKRPSVNVVAKAHARSKELRRIVFLARLAPAGAAAGFPPGPAAGARVNAILGAAAVIGPAVLYGAALLIPGAPRLLLWWLSLPFAAVSLAYAVLTFRLALGRKAPAAARDVSGLAALLETAKVISRAPLLTTSVWFVATGAGDAGPWGALHLFRQCGFDPAKTVAINLDAPSGGRLALTASEGLFPTRRTDTTLVETLREAARAKGIDLSPGPYHLPAMDAAVFLARKVPAASLTGDARGILAGGEIQAREENILAARDLLLGLIRRIDG